MELPSPPVSRPAEHLLRAHLAHGTHHELLAEGQPAALAAAIASVALPPEPPAASTPKPRRRRTTK